LIAELKKRGMWSDDQWGQAVKMLREGEEGDLVCWEQRPAEQLYGLENQ